MWFPLLELVMPWKFLTYWSIKLFVVNRILVGCVVAIVVIAIIGMMYVTNDTSDVLISDSTNNSGTEVSDFSTVEKNVVQIEINNPDYIIDENGNKRYVISAIDSPDLNDWYDFHLGHQIKDCVPIWNSLWNNSAIISK